MNVTSENFNETLPEIEEAINNCMFISIDCELSGLCEISEINAYDTPKEYYEKIQKNSKNFLVIQYGISLFSSLENNEFKQRSYNFYIFRKPINKNIPDQRFLCQTSCINFLISQGFDFNKLFKYGIPYLNVTEENICRETLEEKHQNQQQNTKNIISVPEENQAFIDEIIDTLNDFLNDKEKQEIYLPKCNAFIRRLIYQTVEESFKNKIFLKTVQKSNDRILLATKFNDINELEEVKRRTIENEKTLLDDFIGFSKVIKLIVNSGKLVVGHNLCLDFFHTIDKFITPLSKDYSEFKECAHSLFTKILDTKYMSTSEPFRDFIQSTVLKDLFETLKKSPFGLPKIVSEEGKSYSLDKEKTHEAGYDAFITGISFIAMWKHLADIEECDLDENLLKPYINRIFLMNIKDHQYINLEGDDAICNRDHVFYLTFPKEWKLSNIIQLFSPFGNVHVAWINETSAYVGLHNKDQAAIALNSLSKGNNYTIKTYNKRQLELANGNVISHMAPSPIPAKQKRKIVNRKTKLNKKQKLFNTIIEEEYEEEDRVEEGKNNKIDEEIISTKRRKTFEENDWE